MINVNEDHVEISGKPIDVMTELIFAIDAVVRLHEDEMNLQRCQAKSMVKGTIDFSFDKFIATDEIRENLEETTIRIKIPRGDNDV